MRLMRWVAGAGLLASTAMMAMPAMAEEGGQDVSETQKAETIQGWNAFLDGLRDLPERMVAKLSPHLQSDPQIRQELGRLALEAVASRTLSAISGDPRHPAFLPHLNETLNVFQPNADTVYKSAMIEPGGTYRLRGTQGSVRIASIGQMFNSPDDSASIRPPVYNDLNALEADADGRFDVIISPERPDGYTGDWWKLEPNAVALLLRQVSSDWQNEVDPTISIDRLDIPAPRSRPSGEDLRKRLAALGPSISSTAQFLLGIPTRLRAEGYVNKLQVFDVGTSLGELDGQFYYHGIYELEDDEALVLEAKVPSECLYYSAILTNEIFETTDWVNNHSSLNDAQSIVDPDGVLRIVVSARDPGVPNWLDTAGYDTGVVQGRWTGCNAQPIPKLSIMSMSQLSDHLHPDTATVSASERDRIVRDRRAAYQQRIHW